MEPKNRLHRGKIQPVLPNFEREAIVLKRIARTGVFALVLVSFLFGAFGLQSAAAATPTDIKGTAYIMDTTWNGKMDWTTWDSTHAQTSYISTKNKKFGDYKIELEAKLGYKVQVFAIQKASCSDSTYKAVKLSDSTMLSAYAVCPDSADTVTLFVFMKSGIGKPLYKLWLLWKDDGSLCFIRSTKAPGVEAQKRVCYPGDKRYPDGWKATKAVCAGTYYSNGKWDCDDVVKQYLGKKGK
jgi:hypothetical protein